MPKITKKQQKEIEFMSQYMGDKFKPSEKEINEYIEKTVYGKGDISVTQFMDKTTNRLFLAKRILDIQIKEWKRDMEEGLLAYWELLEDYENHPYIRKVLKNLVQAPDRKSFPPQLVDFFCLAFVNWKERETLTYPL